MRMRGVLVFVWHFARSPARIRVAKGSPSCVALNRSLPRPRQSLQASSPFVRSWGCLVVIIDMLVTKAIHTIVRMIQSVGTGVYVKYVRGSGTVGRLSSRPASIGFRELIRIQLEVKLGFVRSRSVVSNRLVTGFMQCALLGR